MKKIMLVMLCIFALCTVASATTATFTALCESGKTYQVKVEDLTSTTVLQDYTSTGVTYSDNGCFYTIDVTDGHHLIIRWNNVTDGDFWAMQDIETFHPTSGGSTPAELWNYVIGTSTAAALLQGAGVAGDPMLASCPGNYVPGTAGFNICKLTLGNGDTDVNHNTGGTDNLRYATAAGAGIAGATVKAYLKTDYIAGHRTDAFMKGQTITDVNGRWLNDLHLDSGYTYTILFYKTGSFGPDTKEITL